MLKHKLSFAKADFCRTESKPQVGSNRLMDKISAHRKNLATPPNKLNKLKISVNFSSAWLFEPSPALRQPQNKIIIRRPR